MDTLKQDPRPRGRSARFWLCYLTMVGACSLLLLEAAVRMLHLAPTIPVAYGQFEAAALVPFKPRPDSRAVGRSVSDEFDFEHVHNSHGFRDVERALEKPAGAFRVVVLGDSFTYGVGAAREESYPASLERLLQERSRGGRQIEVLNLGIPRYWTEPERRLLEHFGLAYQPDLVLVGFVPNDVIDTFLGYQDLNVSEGYLISREAEALGAVGAQLSLRSDLFRLGVARYVSLQRAGSSRQAQASEIYKANGFHERDWQVIEGELTAIGQLTSRSGAQLCIVYLPPSSLQREGLEYPGVRLAGWSRREGTAFIDTLPALRQAASRRSLYYWPKDGHPNSAGYGVIADSIYAGLVDQGLVP